MRATRVSLWVCAALLVSAVAGVITAAGFRALQRPAVDEEGGAPERLRRATATRPALPPPPYASGWTPEATASFLQSLAAATDRVTVTEIGRSQEGRPLHAAHLGALPTASGSPWRVAIVAGQHGDETASVVAVLQFLWDFSVEGQPTYPWLHEHLALLVVPQANPDGAQRHVRPTACGADMNRDWSLRKLPETAAVAAALQAFRPDLVVDCHELLPRDPKHQPLLEIAYGPLAQKSRLGPRAEALTAAVAAVLEQRGCKARVYRRSRGVSDALHAHYGLETPTPGLLVENGLLPDGWRVTMHHKALWSVLRYLQGLDGARSPSSASAGGSRPSPGPRATAR